jgi:hypothetical protein
MAEIKGVEGRGGYPLSASRNPSFSMVLARVSCIYDAGVSLCRACAAMTLRS